MHTDAQCVQNNILLTQDGQMCLGDFAIAGMFTMGRFSFEDYQPETLRYIAPERISRSTSSPVAGPTKESDVYSLAMTSFSVRACFAIHPTI